MQFPTFKFSNLQFNPTVFSENTPSFIQNLPYTPEAAATPQSEMQQLLSFVERQSGPEATEKRLDQLLGFQKKQMKEAFPYLMARQIPENVAQAFGMANQMRLRGGELGTAAALRGVDAVAQGGFTPYGALQQFSYFS